MKCCSWIHKIWKMLVSFKNLYVHNNRKCWYCLLVLKACLNCLICLLPARMNLHLTFSSKNLKKSPCNGSNRRTDLVELFFHHVVENLHVDGGSPIVLKYCASGNWYGWLSHLAEIPIADFEDQQKKQTCILTCICVINWLLVTNIFKCHFTNTLW